MTLKLKRDDVRSNLEFAFYKHLRGLIRKFKIKIGYEPETWEYIVYRNYTPDFTIEKQDGSVVYIETKGYLRREDRTKLLAVKEQYPDVDLRLVFEKDNKLHSRAKMRYSEWCERHGFLYHIGVHIPEEWLT